MRHVAGCDGTPTWPGSGAIYCRITPERVQPGHFSVMQKLKIFTDDSLIKEGMGVHWLVRPLLDPSLAQKCAESVPPGELKPFDRILAEYNRTAATMFELTDLESCDVVVLPVHWHEIRGGFGWIAKPNRELIREVQESSEKAQRAGKPFVIFFSESRSHEPIPVPGAIVFRHAMYRSRRGALDHAMPVMIVTDPSKEPYGRYFLPDADWHSTPTVGFCGFARRVKLSEWFKTGIQKAYTLAKFGYPDVSQFKGLRVRSKAIDILRASDKTKTKFIVRAESVFLTTKKNYSDKKEQYRDEFYRNIADSDYQLCMRGSANHSRRPWETLSCSRTPLFVDTDCVLPFESLIEWEKRMPIVSEDDLNRMPEHLLDFHSALAGERFTEFQRSQRQFWEEWLSPHGFASKFRQHFESLVLEPLRR